MDILPQGTAQKQCAGSCKQMFPATAEHFSRDKTRKDGLQALCKKCMSEYKKQHYKSNKEEISAKHKSYQEANKKAIRKNKRRYYLDNKAMISSQHKAYREVRKEKLARKRREYCKKNRNSVLAYQRRYYRENIEKIKDYHISYHAEHRDERLAYLREYRSKNRAELRLKWRDHARNSKEEKRAYLKTYSRSPRGRMVRRAAEHRRTARKKAIGGTLTSEQIQWKLKAQHYRCYYAACGRARFEKENGQYVYHIEHTIPLSRTEHNPRHDVNYVVLACPTCNLKKNSKLPHEWTEGGTLF